MFTQSIFACRYAVLATLHYGDVKRDRQRAAKYETWLDELKWEGIKWPFTVAQLSLFERLNRGIAICLLKWDEESDEARLIRAAPLHPDRRVVHILLVKEHYVAVTNLDR